MQCVLRHYLPTDLFELQLGPHNHPTMKMASSCPFSPRILFSKLFLHPNILSWERPAVARIDKHGGRDKRQKKEPKSAHTIWNCVGVAVLSVMDQLNPVSDADGRFQALLILCLYYYSLSPPLPHPTLIISSNFLLYAISSFFFHI